MTTIEIQSMMVMLFNVVLEDHCKHHHIIECNRPLDVNEKYALTHVNSQHLSVYLCRIVDLNHRSSITSNFKLKLSRFQFDPRFHGIDWMEWFRTTTSLFLVFLKSNFYLFMSLWVYYVDFTFSFRVCNCEWISRVTKYFDLIGLTDMKYAEYVYSTDVYALKQNINWHCRFTFRSGIIL